MGHADLYPFILSEPVMKKLGFIHDIIRDSAVPDKKPAKRGLFRRASQPPTAPDGPVAPPPVGPDIPAPMDPVVDPPIDPPDQPPPVESPPSDIPPEIPPPQPDEIPQPMHVG
jgi:hypothetical protein